MNIRPERAEDAVPIRPISVAAYAGNTQADLVENLRSQGDLVVALVAERQLAVRGARLVFVLGDPAYYGRFGIALAVAEPFELIHAGSHFMALRLSDEAPRSGKVRYPAAFDELG